MASQIAETIVLKILYDLTDRRGLRQEWENIDVDTQREIETAWAEIIDSELPKPETDYAHHRTD